MKTEERWTKDDYKVAKEIIEIFAEHARKAEERRESERLTKSILDFATIILILLIGIPIVMCGLI